MSRTAIFALLTSALLYQAADAQIDLSHVAPAPREVRPDGSRDPAPRPAAPRPENPFQVVQRIIKNSNAVGDKLAMTDTGTETRGKQETILKDIQSLIDQQEDPPPPKPDQGQSDDMNKDKMPMGGMDDKKDMSDKGDKGDKGDKQDTPPMQKGMGDKGQKDGKGMSDLGDDEPMGRRPRRQGNEEPKEQKGKGTGGNQKSQPMTDTPMQTPKNTGGKVPDPQPGDPKGPAIPLLPFEDEIVKDVWGHLPDKMRQQATQYYQQDFMPRYTELLKLYYSSLAEKSGKR